MTSTLSALLLLLFNVLVPAKQWFGPAEPLLVRNHSETAIELRMTDFGGAEIGTDAPRRVEPNATADLRVVFPSLQIGTYVAYAVPVGKPVTEFIGTPIVLTIRPDERPGLQNSPAGVRVAPLTVAKFDTTAGPLTAAFYYDFAPNTVTNFVTLARSGFYDGLSFYRLVPNFIVQTGDPTADGSGGPGYHIEAEFNGRPHLKGVLSMARETDPMESQGAAPRPEFANTAGSQFFIALDYNTGNRLDGKYTAFGKLVGDASFATLDKIAKGAVTDASSGKPADPVTINRCEIVPVTAAENPYFTLVNQAQIVERVESK